MVRYNHKAYKTELTKRYKGNNKLLKIAIVVDMWLTGFDVPLFATKYVYKSMSGHILRQTITRARVFKRMCNLIKKYTESKLIKIIRKEMTCAYFLAKLCNKLSYKIYRIELKKRI